MWVIFCRLSMKTWLIQVGILAEKTKFTSGRDSETNLVILGKGPKGSESNNFHVLFRPAWWENVILSLGTRFFRVFSEWFASIFPNLLEYFSESLGVFFRINWRFFRISWSIFPISLGVFFWIYQPRLSENLIYV